MVLGVLKHEMAHQLVSERLGGSSGHGQVFQEACRMLGAPTVFRRAGGDLPGAPGAARQQSETGRVMERLRKIMALTESANEHEALSAIRKARQLMGRHNLSNWPSRKKTRYISTLINLKRKRLANYHKLICSILTGNFQVQIVLTPLYDAHDLTNYKCIDILGCRENVQVAEYVFHFLLERLPALWRNHHGNNSGSRTDKNSYWFGVLKGFREGLENQPPDRTELGAGKESAPTTLPALHNDQAMVDFVAERYPRLRNTRRGTSRINPEHFAAGRKDGQQLKLAKGVAGSHMPPKRLPKSTG